MKDFQNHGLQDHIMCAGSSGAYDITGLMISIRWYMGVSYRVVGSAGRSFDHGSCGIDSSVPLQTLQVQPPLLKGPSESRTLGLKIVE